MQFAPRVNSVKTSHLFFDFIDITFSEKILNEKSVNPAVRMSSVTLNACILGKKSPKSKGKELNEIFANLNLTTHTTSMNKSCCF